MYKADRVKFETRRGEGQEGWTNVNMSNMEIDDLYFLRRVLDRKNVTEPEKDQHGPS